MRSSKAIRNYNIWRFHSNEKAFQCQNSILRIALKFLIAKIETGVADELSKNKDERPFCQWITPAIRELFGAAGKAVYSEAAKFRMNANGNKLDVWLIYRCENVIKAWYGYLYKSKNSTRNVGEGFSATVS